MWEKTKSFFKRTWVAFLGFFDGCSWDSLTDHPILGLLKQSGGTLLWETTKWSLGLGFAGFLLTLFFYFVAKKLGGFNWHHGSGHLGLAKWLRRAFLLLMLLVVPLCTGALGFFEGVLSASRKILREGDLATRYYPALGGIGADFLGGLYFVTPDGEDATDESGWKEAVAARWAEVKAYRAGELEIEAASFERRLRSVSSDVVAEVLAKVKAEAQERFSFLGEGKGRFLLDWLLDGAGKELVSQQVDQEVREEAAEHGWSGPLSLVSGKLFRDLPALAAREGKADQLSHRELSSYLVEQTVAATALASVKAFTRTNQAAVLPFPPAVMMLPLLFFLLLRWMWPEPEVTLPTSSPTPPPESPPASG